MIGKVTRNASFHRIAQYIFDKPGAEALLQNVPEGRTVAEKAEAMQFVAARNHRVKRPAYHLSLSPPEADNLSRTDWLLVCDRVLDELGLGDNQVLVGLHHDVKYPNSDKTRTHAHLLINLVNDEGKCASTSWDYYKIPKILRHLERCYRWQCVPDVLETDKQRDSSGQYRLEQRSGADSNSAPVVHRSVRRKLQEIIDEVLKHSSSFEDLVSALEKLGVQVHSSAQGWWMEYERIAFAGYQLGRAYTQPSILKSLEVEHMSNVEEENSEVSVPEVVEESPVSSMQEVFLSESAQHTVGKPELNPEPKESEAIAPVIKSSPETQSANPEVASKSNAEGPSPTSNSPDWIDQMKRQAHQLEQTELIDGKFGVA